MIPTTAQLGGEAEAYRALAEKISNTIRVAVPGIVTAFNASAQTVSVQPSIRERVKNQDGTSTETPLPVLLDVPICLPRAGGFALTMPVKAGDECLVVFADNCINAWFSSGGVQGQEEKRRHDLSDAFAILGTWSQPNRITGFLSDGAQLKSLRGGATITIKDNEIDIDAQTVKINGTTIELNGSSVKAKGTEIP